jgi:hypothetical protein
MKYLLGVLRFSISGLVTRQPEATYIVHGVVSVTMLGNLMHTALTMRPTRLQLMECTVCVMSYAFAISFFGHGNICSKRLS